MFNGLSSLREKDENKKELEEIKLRNKYLEKYRDNKKKKRKNHDKKSFKANVKLVDTEVNILTNPIKRIDDIANDEDKPTFVILDHESHLILQNNKKNEKYYPKGQWKVIDDDDDDNKVKKEIINKSDAINVNVEVEDLSPPRKNEDLDLSPPRENKKSLSDTSDLSPPRKNKLKDELKNKEKKKGHGFMKAEEFKKEKKEMMKETQQRFEKISDLESGKNAEPLYRDNQGRKITYEEYKKRKEIPKKKNKITWEEVEWSRGLAQQKEAKEFQEETIKELKKPFARGINDKEIDDMYKQQRRWGDPFSNLPQKHKIKEDEYLAPVIDKTYKDMFKKQKFRVPQEIPNHSWIKRRAVAPTNRFGISPGRHWDGVDRSNGYEKEYLQFLNEKASRDKEARLWSMEDM